MRLALSSEAVLGLVLAACGSSSTTNTNGGGANAGMNISAGGAGGDAVGGQGNGGPSDQAGGATGCHNNPPGVGGSGGAPQNVELNGCTQAMFVDRSCPSDDRIVQFGKPPMIFSYAPKCMVVAAGEAVTFEGKFSDHPLTPGAAPGATMAGSPQNPIPHMMDDTPPLEVKFPIPGVYGYYCGYHYGGDMAGVVWVR